MHCGFHVDAATQTLQQQLNDSWNMTLIIANELPPILSKPQSNQESTRLSGTGCAVEAVRLRKPWSTLLDGCHCCFSAVGSWDLLWKVRTFYVCLHGFPWGALVSPPIKNLPHSPVTVLLTTVLAYSCSWSPGFAVLKSQDGLNAGNEFPYWDQ